MASQSADGHVCALINPCSPICNMQLNVLNDLAEAMKALEEKKVLWWVGFLSTFYLPLLRVWSQRSTPRSLV